MRKLLFLIVAVLVLSAPMISSFAEESCSQEAFNWAMEDLGCRDRPTMESYSDCVSSALIRCMEYGRDEGGGDGYWTCYWVGLICIPIYTY